jgi:hypothetical protein
MNPWQSTLKKPEANLKKEEETLFQETTIYGKPVRRGTRNWQA